MTNNYIEDYLRRGADPSIEDVFVLSSAIRRAFLHVPSLYDVETVSVHLGHYNRERRQIVLETADMDVSASEAPPWMRSSVKGTYYGDRPNSFGPLERDGIHFTDAKPHPTTGPDYAESIECVVLPESFAELAQSPAMGFNVLCPDKPPYFGGATCYFSGDGRLLYLPYDRLRHAQGTLAEFTLAHGQLVNFDLLRQRAALPKYLDGDTMAFYAAMMTN